MEKSKPVLNEKPLQKQQKKEQEKEKEQEKRREESRPVPFYTGKDVEKLVLSQPNRKGNKIGAAMEVEKPKTPTLTSTSTATTTTTTVATTTATTTAKPIMARIGSDLERDPPPDDDSKFALVLVPLAMVLLSLHHAYLVGLSRI